MKVLVVGAGIFGVTIALKLSDRHSVTLVDMNDDIMQNASRVNHNRLHFGFHYPRSRETAIQSLSGYLEFSDYFRDAITSDFDNYYMIERNGNVSSDDYESFCDSLDLKYKKEYPEMDINFSTIESSYLTNEPIFDYDIMKARLLADLAKSGVKVVLSRKISRKSDLDDYHVIVNATYFNFNKTNSIWGLDKTRLIMQTVVIPIFKSDIRRVGLTIMDGKFCSVMPKGFNDGLFLLYHAKESIIYQTKDYEIPALWYYGKQIIRNDFVKKNIYDKFVAKRNILNISKASERYFRFLGDSEFIDYWQTIRSLPINDNDERLSVLNVSEVGDKKVISVLSGKISTCLLIADYISDTI